jgi:DNA invertase Pin-like site-specific DNA recombinase
MQHRRSTRNVPHRSKPFGPAPSAESDGSPQARSEAVRVGPFPALEAGRARDRAPVAQHAERPSGGEAPTPVVGYVCVSGQAGSVNGQERATQTELLMRECVSRDLELTEVVTDREPRNGKAFERPALEYALRRIAAGKARGLVVSEVSRLTRSAAELARILEWLLRAEGRFVAVTEGFDTGEREGRLAARMLIAVSVGQHDRLSERTREGLEVARQNGRRRGRPAVADDDELLERILEMRSHGLTLQAIADRLNEAGVPTVRGGAKWRPSSVQTAIGYRRRRQPFWLLADAAANSSRLRPDDGDGARNEA